MSISCINSSRNKGTTEKSIVSHKFIAPKIPSVLTAQEDQMDFMIKHYWDNFNFADTTLVSRPDITEPCFVDYINILSLAPLSLATEGLEILMTKAEENILMYSHFMEITEKYLYNPNSPYCNENLYIAVLQSIITSDVLSDIYKIRPKHQLEIALKNRVSTKATDFTYTFSNGKKAQLHSLKSKYTVIFFNNPDCYDCKRVKGILTNEEIFSNNQNLKILALYVDKDIKLWRNSDYPSTWINAYDKGSVITKNELFDLKAIPTLYLLDKDKRVILKDAPIEVIANYLINN